MVLALISYFLLAPIFFYKWFISPFLPAACRYQPTCSAYAIDAIKSHGPLQGTLLAVKRIASCHPWGGNGYRPFPENLTREKKLEKKSMNKKALKNEK